MAEFDLSKFTEYIKGILPQAEAQLAAVTARMKELADAGKTTGQEYVKLKQESDMLTQVTSGLSAAFGNAVGGLKQMADRLPEVGKAAAGVLGPIKNLAEGFGGNLWEALKNSAGAMALASSTVRNAANPIAETSNVVKTTAAIFGKFGAALVGLNEAQRNLIAVQDPMRTAFVMAGKGAEEAKEAAKDYAQELRATQFASNFAAKDIHAFNVAVGADLPKGTKIGGEALAEISKVLGTDIVTANTAAMTAFRAFGMTGTEAAQATVKALRGFNQDQVETVRQLGLMHRAATTMDVNVGVARKQIVQASSHMAIFGQQTGAATNMWTTFMSSLKGTVPIEEVGKMVNQLTSGLAKMKMENRAFISMMSGMGRGATALGGALKMELAMRGPEGMQRHMQGLTRTLQRFAGGRIISLEQAAKNPQLEQQFILQRQMLGQLTGLQETEQQNRVLETLQKVQSGGMSRIEAAGAMQDVLKKGKSLQEQTVTELEKHTRFWQISLGQQTDVPFQGMTGALAENFKSVFSNMGREAADPTKQILNNAKLVGDYINSVREGAVGGVNRMTGAIETNPLAGVTRHGRERERLQSGWLERGLLQSRFGTFLTQPGRGRQALRPPTGAAARVRMPAARRPVERIGRVGEVIHRDLQHLIRTTRDGFATLKEGKTAGEAAVLGGAAAGERTITVRIIGDEEKVLNKVADEISGAMKNLEDRQRNNTLGISD